MELDGIHGWYWAYEGKFRYQCISAVIGFLSIRMTLFSAFGLGFPFLLDPQNLLPSFMYFYPSYLVMTNL